MTESRTNCALTGLQWTLGVVTLIEAILFVMPSARHDFARTHLPEVIRYVLGWGEIAGSIFLLIPHTAARGAWLLLAVFAVAIAIHLLHGMFNVGNLAIYIAAAWVIAVGKAA
jgi:hypothetical protein